MASFSGSTDGAAVASACRRDPLLRAWLREPWIDPRVLHEQALARPFVRYVVVDDLFHPERLATIMAAYEDLTFYEDDPGLSYDSHAARVDNRAEMPGMELFMHPLWHAWVASVLGVRLREPGQSVVKLRRHPRWSRGFWIHTDRDSRRPKTAAVLAYFNRAWRVEDGGLLQLWEVRRSSPGSRPVFRWNDFVDARLDFLEDSRSLMIEAAAVEGVELVEARLLDQIVPRFNRIVLLDFDHSEAFHSVTPSHGRERKGILQWLY